MSGLFAIYKKEIVTYFRSPIAYFLISSFLLGTGYFFIYNVFSTGAATMDLTFRDMAFLLMILIPVLTMRIFAGEYAGRTMDLLVTLPIFTWQIVLGKYLAAVTILLIMTLATFINLIPMFFYGNPHIINIVSGYIGFVLLGMASISIGQLYSALTKNQIIAALLTLPTLLGFWWLGQLQNMQSSAFMQNFVGYLAFSIHYSELIRGLLRSEAVVYYLLVILTSVTLTINYIKWRR